MARKRRLQSDSEGEEEEGQDPQEESSQAKKKRVSSATDADEEEAMEEDGLNCSQAPDFVVSTSVSFCSAESSHIIRGAKCRWYFVFHQ